MVNEDESQNPVAAQEPEPDATEIVEAEGERPAEAGVRPERAT